MSGEPWITPEAAEDWVLTWVRVVPAGVHVVTMPPSVRPGDRLVLSFGSAMPVALQGWMARPGRWEYWRIADGTEPGMELGV